jgi:hypothetical protein
MIKRFINLLQCSRKYYSKELFASLIARLTPSLACQPANAYIKLTEDLSSGHPTSELEWILSDLSMSGTIKLTLMDFANLHILIHVGYCMHMLSCLSLILSGDKTDKTMIWEQRYKCLEGQCSVDLTKAFRHCVSFELNLPTLSKYCDRPPTFVLLAL